MELELRLSGKDFRDARDRLSLLSREQPMRRQAMATVSLVYAFGLETGGDFSAADHLEIPSTRG